MADASVFSGFPKQGLTFFSQLAPNNTKTWFDAHRSDYDHYVMGPSREFVLAMGRLLKKISPGVQADPRVNKSIFRINRDTRFSKDKRPYKTHQGLWFWEGPGQRMECSGYYLQFEPSRLMLGAGIHCFPRSLLEDFRQSVVHAQHGASLARAVARVSKSGPYILGGKNYKKIPRGYDPKHKHAEFLLYDGLYFGQEMKIPKEFHSAEFVDFCLERYKAMKPLHQWLLALTERAS